MAASRITIRLLCLIVLGTTGIAIAPGIPPIDGNNAHIAVSSSVNSKKHSNQSWKQRSFVASDFIDFYTSHNYPAPAASVDVRRGFLADKNALTQDQSSIPDNEDIQLMNRLWSALTQGNLPKEERFKPRSIPGYNYVDELKENLNSGSFLEIGTGVTSYHLSTLNIATTTIASLVIPDYYLPLLSKYSEGHVIYYHTLQIDDLMEAVDYLNQDYQVMFGTILLSNLTTLVADSLPHEFEEFLAKIISMSKETLVSHAHTKDPSMEVYFNNWESINELLRRACDIGGLECKIALASKTPVWTLQDDTLLSRVMLKSAERPLPSELCNQIETGKECSLVYLRNSVDELTIQYKDDDDSFTLPPVRTNSIPLKTLLRLGPTQSTKEHLIHQLLLLPHSSETSSQMLHILGHRMKLDLPKDDELYLDQDGELEILRRWIGIVLQRERMEENNHLNGNIETEQTNYRDIDNSPKLQKPLKQIKAPLKEYGDVDDHRLMFEKNVAGIERRNYEEKRRLENEKFVKSEEPKYMVYPVMKDVPGKKIGIDDPDDYQRPQDTQVDGVAQIWNRENEPRGIPDKNHLQKLGEHWDRDDVGTDQDAALKNTDTVLRSVEKILTRDEDEDSELEEETKDIDAELTNDEKELKKAMKILASETNDNGIHDDIHPDIVAQEIPNTADMQINSQNSNFNLKKVIPDAEVLTPEKTEVKLGNFMNDKIKRGRENKKRDMQDADKMELKDIKAKDVINHVDDKVKLKSNKLSNILLKRDGYSEKINKVKSENHFQRRLLDVGEDGDISSQRKQLSKLLESFSLGYESPDAGNHDNSLDIDTVTTIDSGNVNNQDESTESTEADLEDDLPLPLSSLHTRQQDASNNHQEELLYDAQWKILQKYFRNSDANFNLLTYGGEHQSLLGAKVAHMYPNSTVVTVIPPLLRMRKIIEKHRKLQQSLSLYNNLLINRPFTSETVYNMHRMPEFFRFQVLGLPVFNQIASMGHYFSQYLGRLLSMAKTTFIEVPSPSQLVLADILLGNHTEVQKNGPSVYKGLIFEALNQAGVKGTVHMIDDKQSGGTLKLLKIEVTSLKRKVYLDCSDNLGELSLTPEGAVALTPLDSGLSVSQGYLSRAGKMVGLNLLLYMGLPNTEKILLFKQYLMLPQYKDMCPLHIVWNHDTLTYSTVVSSSSRPVLDQETLQMETRALSELIMQQIGGEPFSFMQYNSKNGDLLLSLASKYKNSTFINLMDNVEGAEKLYKRVKQMNLTNLLVAALPDTVDDTLTHKLVESPEFFRYQFIDLEEFLLLIGTLDDRESFNRMLGEIISSSVTTFIQLPSAQTMSLAFSTFYPADIFDGRNSKELTKEDLYLHDNHPFNFYKNGEIKIIRESAKSNANTTVITKVIYPSYSPPAIDYSWNVLRVDVTNLSTIVNHHFDYEIDMHERKYTLHCLSNESNYNVYLIRNQDGFKIPYGNIHAVTVIALLRMGLLPEIREWFYDMFVHLPLYEDMAPWNIAFMAGHLEYIDYDTKDFTLTRMVPAAYQVMSMLMNYRRTLHDFGKCPLDAPNQYNFPFISSCVGSDFSGPCTDSRFPVPCGDHTCRSTYVECLQALSDLENRLHIKQSVISYSSFTEDKGLSESGKKIRQWAFDSNGIIEKKKNVLFNTNMQPAW